MPNNRFNDNKRKKRSKTSEDRKSARKTSQETKQSVEQPLPDHSQKSDKRVKKLFSDMASIVERPLAEDNSFGSLRDGAPKTIAPLVNADTLTELESLKALVRDLEAQLAEAQRRAASASASTEERAAAPILYEKERIGFAYKGNQVEPIQPESVADANIENALVTPLIASGATIGEMQVQTQRPWTPDEMNLANAVAQQVSLQIENLRLLAAAERARSDAQSATRRFMHESWASYLDAINQRERIGFAYNQNEVKQYLDPSTDGFDYQETISVMEEQVGRLYLKADPARPLTNEDKALVAAVARQLAQQVENLRLLAEASRARSEAEEASRRLTRENWDSYVSDQKEDDVAFIYDANQVIPLDEKPNDVSFTQPIQVRGETIGELSVAGWDNVSPQAAELAAAVAERVSAHLENLRLLEQTESALVRTEQLSRQNELILGSAGEGIFGLDEHGNHTFVNDAVASVLGFGAEELIGRHSHSIWHHSHPDGSHYAEEDCPIYHTLRDGQVRQGDEFFLNKDGESVPVTFTCTPIREGERVVGAVVSFLDITERKKAEAIIARRAAELATVSELSAAISNVLELDHLLQSVVDLSQEKFKLYHAHIYVMNERGDALKLAAGAGEPGRQIANENRLIQLESDKSLAARVTRDRRGLLVNNVSLDPDYRAHPLLPLTRSQLAVPLVFGEMILGVMEIFSDEANHFTEEDVNIQNTLATQVATSMQNARQYQRTLATAAELAGIQGAVNEAAIVAITDVTGKIQFANDNFVNISQYSREELMGQDHRMLNSGYHPKEFIRNLWVTIANGKVWRNQIRNKAKDGSYYWVDTTIAPILDERGKPVQYLAVRFDITERKRAEEALARRAAELATVAEVGTTTASTLEPDLLLQAVVDLTKEQFNVYHAHVYLTDQSWNMLLLAAGAGEAGRKMVAEGLSIPIDAERSLVARATRERKAVRVNDVRSDPGFLPNPNLPNTRSELAVPMIVGDQVLGVFDVQSDVINFFTEEDANIYATLASQVAVSLQNARLYAEQSATVLQLRELDRLKSSFLANMSHELRTPLNSILGFADVILEGLDGPLTENMDNDLRLIQKNGQHLLHLINDVLDMAKIEAGRMNLNPEKFLVHEIIAEVTSITSTLASEKNISLFIEKDSDQEVEVFADRTRIRQVMINLVNNSIKFTETGKIAIRADRKAGDRVLISVKDTGIGIPPDKLEAVFQEFTQVDTSTTRKVGGTGLGLPISRRLVEMHGGRLWAESTGVLGEGSTFFVELPLEAQLTEPVEQQTKAK